MSRVPETRASLILRLPSTGDADAWAEFASIYEPFVYRFAVRGGLQDADAHELVQDVMLSVAKAVGRWKPDSSRARFRTWLFHIARNQLLDALAKRQRQLTASGGTSFFGHLGQFSESAETTDQLMRLEHRRVLFRWAADRIQAVVKPATWQAFWLTAVDEKSVEEVASQLGLTTGAVYIARSRVLAKMRDEVAKWEDDNEMS